MSISARVRTGLPPALREAGLLLFFCSLAVFHTGLWRDPGHRIGPSGDSAHHVFVVNWAARHLFTAPQRVLEGNVFFPFHGSVAFFEPVLGPAILAAPFAPFVASPILLHNLAVLLVLTVASYGAYRLGLHVLDRRSLAVLLAVALPYSGHLAGHYGHLNILAASGFPFLMLGLLRLKEIPDVGAALLTGLAFGLEATTSGYYAVAAALLMAIGLAWAGRALLKPRALLLATGALALGASIVLPWAWTFLSLQSEAGLVRDLGQSREAAFTFGRFFHSPSHVWFPVFGSDVDVVFPGAVVTILGAIGLFTARGRQAWLFRILFAVFVLLALGPDTDVLGHRIALPFGLAWRLVPALRAARHPLTFVVPGIMALTVLGMMALARWNRARRPVVLWLLGGLIVAETWAPWPLVERDTRLSPAYDRLAQLPPGAFLEVPLGGTQEEQWQWHAIVHGLPVVNGFAPFTPELHRKLCRLTRREWSGRPARDLSATRALEYLKRYFPVRYVLVHGDGWTARSIARTPSFTLVTDVGANERIYSLRRSGRGTVVERQCRDDQLRGQGVWLRARSAQRTALHVHFNGSLLTDSVVGPETQELRLRLPVNAVVRGQNTLRLTAAQPFELVDFECAATLTR